MSNENKEAAVIAPTLRGRRRIYSDVDEVNESNLFDVLHKAMIVHDGNRAEISYLLNYEKGVQPLVRNKTVRKEIDIKVCDNVANQITEFKLGYNWGNPILYVQRGNYDLKGSGDTENSNQDLAISILNEMNDAEFSFSKDQELARYVEIVGIGHQFVDIKKRCTGGSVFDLITLNPLFTFCIYRNSARQEKLASVTYRELENGEKYYTVFTNQKRYEVRNLIEIVNGKEIAKWSFAARSGEKNPLGINPIVEFNRAHDRTGCFERQISDMDALNIEVSDFANSVAQNTQEIWWGNDFEFAKDDDGKTKPPESGQWVMTTSGEGKNPMIQALKSDFEFVGVQENIVSKRNLILQKCYVPLQSEPGGGSTGSAMSMSSGWSAAESSACKEEQILRRGKMEIIELELQAIELSGGIKKDNPLKRLSVSDIKPQFTRNKTYDLATKVNSMVTMIKNGINGRVAMETVDLFQDVAQAWADSKELIEKYQISLFEKKAAESEPDDGKQQSDLSDQTGNSPILDGMSMKEQQQMQVE